MHGRRPFNRLRSTVFADRFETWILWLRSGERHGIQYRARGKRIESQECPAPLTPPKPQG